VTRSAIIIITLLLVLVVHKESFSQQIIHKELDLSQDLSIWYDSVAGLDNTVLRQGVLADVERKALRTHPFLYDYKWQSGDVLYQEQQFKNVRLLYNIEEDLLITQGEGLSPYTQFIELKSDRISNFRIRHSMYIWVNESIQGNNSGFYEIIFEGAQLDLLAKRTKTLNLNGTELIYDQKDQYFVHYNDEYFVIRNSGDLARKFKSNRRRIKEFARQNQIRKLNAQVDYEFVELLKFCDNLEL
jgi:hypothetical protein